jgi:hypothetical protein
MWRLAGDPGQAEACFVCKECGHVSSRWLMTAIDEPMASAPDA